MLHYKVMTPTSVTVLMRLRRESKRRGKGSINIPQSCSSSPSEHSGKPLHLRWPLMHDWSPHVNMPSGHCVWHTSDPSSSPAWQSASPSHSQSRRMHEKPPMQAYSSARQVVLGQFWKVWCYVLKKNCPKSMHENLIAFTSTDASTGSLWFTQIELARLWFKVTYKIIDF